MKLRVVLDTCVLVSALRSRSGASFKILSLVGHGRFETSISVPLLLEYEDATKRISRSLGLTRGDIDDILDYICAVSRHQRIFYLWRPLLRDPDDDMVLELAVASQARYIVTHNIRDFAGIEQFAVQVVTPRELLEKIGELA